MTAINRRMTIRRYPDGAPAPSDFEVLSGPMPEINDGEVLGRAIYWTVDPYIRVRLSPRMAAGYADHTELGEAIGAEAVYQVAASRNARFKEGDLVAGFGGWQEYCALPGDGLRRVDPKLGPPAHHLGALGMPGLTAYAGLTRVAQAKAGEALLVSAALGGVGSVAGAIGRALGCHVVGVASSADKCQYAVDHLGYHACLDRTRGNFKDALAAAFPDGIDIDFENVGGDVFWAALGAMKTNGRIVVCGLASGYNDGLAPVGIDQSPALLRAIALKRLTVMGLMVMDFWSLYPEFQENVSGLIRSGAFSPKLHVVDGIEHAGQALIDMLAGASFGKTVVRVAADPTL